MHHDGGKGAMSTLRFLLKAKQLGANIDTKDSMLAFMQSGTPEAKEALSVLAPSTRNRAQEDPSRFLNTWYVSGPIKVAEYALRGEIIHRKWTSTQSIDNKPETEPNNAPPTTTESAPPPNLTPRERLEAARIRSMPKPNFDYQAVYVLGCGVPEQNNLRAVIGAELALKNGASYMTSGGPTTKFRAKGTTEGESAYNYVTSNPEYNRKFEEQNITGAIEDKSTNTSENFEKLIKYAKNKGLKKILIVTTETGNGTRKGHGAEGARRLKKLYPEVEVSFYAPENPNIDRNVLA